jgi:O-antigen/teichoic acid export membrane protein
LLANLALRGATSVARFALMVGVARLASIDDLGTLGIVLALVNVTNTALGLNFFQFAAREMLAVERDRWPRMLRDQAALHLVTYSIALLPLAVGFALSTLPSSAAPWLAVIVVLEHANQELQRILVVASKPLHSNILLFLRSGLWVYAVVLAMMRYPSLAGLQLVWWGWTLGATAAFVFGLWSLRDLPWRSPLGPVDRAWLRRGVRSAVALFVGLVCVRSIFAVDRQLLEGLVSLEAVGTYTFFAGVANTVVVLTDSGVLTTLYPDLIRSYQAGDLVAYRATMHRMLVGALAMVLVLCLGFAVAVVPVVGWIGKPELARGQPVLWLLLVAAVLQVAAQLVRNALYVRKLDRHILASCAAGLVVAVLANAAMIPVWGILGAGMATLLATAAMLVVSCIVLPRSRPGAASPPGGGVLAPSLHG